jgi:hypothetical protein
MSVKFEALPVSLLAYDPNVQRLIPQFDLLSISPAETAIVGHINCSEGLLAKEVPYKYADIKGAARVFTQD